MIKRLCIPLVLIILLVGCSNSTNENSKGYSNTVKSPFASESIQQLTEKTISNRYKQATNIDFEDYKRTDNVNYLAFTFKNNKTPYYGFTVANKNEDKWELADFEENRLDKKQPVTFFQYIGTYPGTEERKFHITAGYVNSNDIRQILLYYPNSNVKLIQLAEDQFGFLDVDTDSDISLIKIEGKSKKGQILYQKVF